MTDIEYEEIIDSISTAMYVLKKRSSGLDIYIDELHEWCGEPYDLYACIERLEELKQSYLNAKEQKK